MVSLAAWYRMTEINETSSITNTGIVNIALKAFSPCTAIVLNSLAIHALIRTSSLPKPTKTLLLSLAMSDLSVGLVSQPLFIARILRQSFSSVYFISLVFQTALAHFRFLESALNVDRLLAIYLRVRYQELVTQRRVVRTVNLLWVLSCFLPAVSFLCLIPAELLVSI